MPSSQGLHCRLMPDAQLPTPVPTLPSSLTVSTAPSKIPLADIVSDKVVMKFGSRKQTSCQQLHMLLIRFKVEDFHIRPTSRDWT